MKMSRMTLGEDAEELIPDREYQDGDDETIESLMEVLTVTSKNLQAMTQGRKFRAAPKRSIEDRRKPQPALPVGSWVTGPATKFPVSAKGKGKGDCSQSSSSSKPASASSHGHDKKGMGAQKVSSVRHSGGHEILYDFGADGRGATSTVTPPRLHQSLVVFQTAEC